MKKSNKRFKGLLAYQKAYDLALQIFKISKKFPKEERYSLTDQIRRSSRSVCVNIAEGYNKRQYPNHFKSKLSDAQMENGETDVWLDFSFSFEYITDSEHERLISLNDEIGKLINYMIQNPNKFS